jgi:ribosome-associated protein
LSDPTDPSAKPTRTAEPAAGDAAPRISLDDFLKTGGYVGTGGQAKFLIQGGDVRVNGQTETRRRRKLQPGDVIELLGKRIVVPAAEQRS